MKVISLVPDEQGMVQWPALSTSKKTVIALGAFDGVHRGHQSIIKKTVEVARRHDALSVVIMMDPRPKVVHAYANSHAGLQPPDGFVDTQALSSIDQRLRLVNQFGVDYVIILHYTVEFSRKSYRFFLGQLVGKLGMRTLVLGEDSSFGANCAGTIEAVQRFVDLYGMFEIEVVEDSGDGRLWIPRNATHEAPEHRGEPEDLSQTLSKAEYRAWTKAHDCVEVRKRSSSHVRHLLSRALIRQANTILGHHHLVEGVVVHGEERGRTIGFPTANLGSLTQGYIPVDGVYAGWLIDLGLSEEIASTKQKYPVGEIMPYDHRDDRRLALHSPWRIPAAISIGHKPTFTDGQESIECVVEAYALSDDWLELYDHRVCIEFAQFIRPQITFHSVDDLVEELKKNAQETREIIATIK